MYIERLKKVMSDYSMLILVFMVFASVVILIGSMFYTLENNGRVESVDRYLTDKYLIELKDKGLVKAVNVKDGFVTYISIELDGEVYKTDFTPESRIGLPQGVLSVENNKVEYQDRTEEACGDASDPDPECIKEKAERFVELTLISLNKTMDEYKEINKGESYE